jgi:HD-like signal output (HDOD) protein
VLFVDDEPSILDGLQRLLRSERDRWDAVYALGGEAAMAELERTPFDVIVSDMRMPRVDGAALLAHVREQYPNMVRIVLSGHTELESAMRAAPVAHQFLTKPCDAQVLKCTIRRALALLALLGDVALRRLVGRLGALPSAPQHLAQLMAATEDPEVSLGDIARIIERDMAMCARCLQLVNSAFFGLPRRVNDVAQAVSYLGTGLIRNLLLTHEIFNAFDPAVIARGFDAELLYRHSLLTAKVSARLSTNTVVAADAFMAGMLHDVGTLLLATKLPRELEAVLALANDEGLSLEAAERATLGVSHAQLGAYLLGLWGLPYPIVEAVAFHHRPAEHAIVGLDALAAVYIGNLLAHEAEPDGHANDVPDLPYLARLGVIPELDVWRAMAVDLARELEVASD